MRIRANDQNTAPHNLNLIVLNVIEAKSVIMEQITLAEKRHILVKDSDGNAIQNTNGEWLVMDLIGTCKSLKENVNLNL